MTPAVTGGTWIVPGAPVHVIQRVRRKATVTDRTVLRVTTTGVRLDDNTFFRFDPATGEPLPRHGDWYTQHTLVASGDPEVRQIRAQDAVERALLRLENATSVALGAGRVGPAEAVQLQAAWIATDAALTEQAAADGWLAGWRANADGATPRP